MGPQPHLPPIGQTPPGVKDKLQVAWLMQPIESVLDRQAGALGGEAEPSLPALALALSEHGTGPSASSELQLAREQGVSSRPGALL